MFLIQQQEHFAHGNHERRNLHVKALNSKGTRFFFSVPSQNLQKSIPDIYWLTILGRPYVKMFGRDKLLCAPVYHVEAIDDELIIIQLTPSLDDMRNDVVIFARAREQLKSFLGKAAFFPGVPVGKNLLPDFVWEESTLRAKQ